MRVKMKNEIIYGLYTLQNNEEHYFYIGITNNIDRRQKEFSYPSVRNNTMLGRFIQFLKNNQIEYYTSVLVPTSGDNTLLQHTIQYYLHKNHTLIMNNVVNQLLPLQNNLYFKLVENEKIENNIVDIETELHNPNIKKVISLQLTNLLHNMLKYPDQYTISQWSPINSDVICKVIKHDLLNITLSPKTTRVRYGKTSVAVNNTDIDRVDIGQLLFDELDLNEIKQLITLL